MTVYLTRHVWQPPAEPRYLPMDVRYGQILVQIRQNFYKKICRLVEPGFHDIKYHKQSQMSSLYYVYIWHNVCSVWQPCSIGSGVTSELFGQIFINQFGADVDEITDQQRGERPRGREEGGGVSYLINICHKLINKYFTKHNRSSQPLVKQGGLDSRCVQI